MNRGFNDTSEATTQAVNRFVLRLSGHSARSPADVAAETTFLAYLGAAGAALAVTEPVQDGTLFTTAVRPDGFVPPRCSATLRGADRTLTTPRYTDAGGGSSPPLDAVLQEHFPWCTAWETQLRALFADYVGAKQAQSVLDYDDLLLYCAQMVSDPALAAHIGYLRRIAAGAADPSRRTRCLLPPPPP